eukprot:Plantae.Rhodophyta-Purpureofilum_apyrenoidigerum.ctg3022.p1 GENE.Plantae.Rhodophyta-Purpureofilum_apyrenoidigerum.ctg3022~~Plantae.Rhodophyta-Purpureofilum_apyrenoidigerum.ctg3022.p1  ORF type:complete len:163 (+),score=19.66 Plantae.Rhodophyta-Purpureofilum_apyrenoidigerum.ctg3022:225-713(+)
MSDDDVPVWDLPLRALILFFQYVRAPKMRIDIPEVKAPPAKAVFPVVLVMYYFVTSGIIFVILRGPPLVGTSRDPSTGQVRAAVMSGTLNSQYVYEGFGIGMLFMLGAGGALLLHSAVKSKVSLAEKYIRIGLGIAALVFAETACEQCLQVKYPRYLKGFQA